MSNVDRFGADGDELGFDFDAADAGQGDQVVECALEMRALRPHHVGHGDRESPRPVELAAHESDLAREPLELRLAVSDLSLHQVPLGDAWPDARIGKGAAEVRSRGRNLYLIPWHAIGHLPPSCRRDRPLDIVAQC